MAKIKNDKYYTPKELAEYCVNKTKEIVGEENISEYFEPSGGNGVFLDFLPKGTYSCDIEPEDDRIEKQDYLTLDLEYKKGRCVIGNPPFGEKGNLIVKFYNKSIEIADYICFILPISQYKNDVKLYKFDLISPEDLGRQFYTDRYIHCCFNIYRRPNNYKLNNKKSYKLNDLEIIEIIKNKNPKRNKPYNGFNYDYAICAWGASIGKEIDYNNQYAKEFYFVINNDILKNRIIEVIKNADWKNIYKMTATPNLLHWQVYKYLKEQIQEIE